MKAIIYPKGCSLLKFSFCRIFFERRSDLPLERRPEKSIINFSLRIHVNIFMANILDLEACLINVNFTIMVFIFIICSA